MNNIKMEAGTITFWTEPDDIIFNNNTLKKIININTEEGSIFILKDTDNKIKYFYVLFGKGRTDIEWDCSKLDPTVKHMIGITWSQPEKQIKLYVDGELKGEKKIKGIK